MKLGEEERSVPHLLSLFLSDLLFTYKIKKIKNKNNKKIKKKQVHEKKPFSSFDCLVFIFSQTL